MTTSDRPRTGETGKWGKATKFASIKPY